MRLRDLQADHNKVGSQLINKLFLLQNKGKTCDILKAAIERYRNILKNTYLIADRHSKKLMNTNTNRLNNTDTDANDKRPLQELQINLTAPCETYPHLGMDERCEFYVNFILIYSPHIRQLLCNSAFAQKGEGKPCMIQVVME